MWTIFLKDSCRFFYARIETIVARQRLGIPCLEVLEDILYLIHRFERLECVIRNFFRASIA